jgi:hypothetical protein
MKKSGPLFAACAAVFVCAMVSSVSAVASLVTVNMTGEANSVDSALDPYFSVGDPMTASLTYDSSAPPLGGGLIGRYFLDAITSLSFKVGGSSGVLASTPNEIDLVNQAPSSLDSIHFYAGFTLTPSLSEFRPFRFSFGLLDTSGTVFDSLYLPESIDLADFSPRPWSLEFWTPSDLTVRVTGSINLEPIPIPTATWLFGSGLLGLVGIARKKAA